MIRNIGAVIIDSIRYDFIKSTFDNLTLKESLLDLGCGVKPFAHIYNQKVKHSIGVEVKSSLHDQSKVDVFYDGKSLPFKDSSFDVIFSSEVLEHVPDPNEFLKEMKRVLKPEGILIITVPFFVPLHEKPFDFYRYTEFGLKQLAKNNNYVVQELVVFGDYIGVMISLLIIPHLKFWNYASKLLNLKILKTIYNPIVFLFIYIPQICYLKLKKIKGLKRYFKKMEYVPKGYGMVLKKMS